MKFVCSKCGDVKNANTRQMNCCICGGLFNLDNNLPVFDVDKIDKSNRSIFRYRRFMALQDDTAWRDITMGEGLTPVIRLNDNILLKMDYIMPTLSFKDRGAAVVVSHAKAIGVDYVLQDSSGNAGNSIAAYCARAGIKCEIFVPEGTSQKKISMIKAHGAALTVVKGSRDNCADVCRNKAKETGIYYASHVYNPLFYEGTKTFIYEIYEELNSMPSHLVIPVGNGTLFLGAIYALEHLYTSGAISKMPQIIAVQSENCSPLLNAALISKNEPADITPSPTLAEGIAIAKPMRGDEILRLAYKYDVRFVNAPEGEIIKARDYLAKRGIYVEFTSAANYAAYVSYCLKYGKPQDCLITMCGAGLKSESPVENA